MELDHAKCLDCAPGMSSGGILSFEKGLEGKQIILAVTIPRASVEKGDNVGIILFLAIV